MNVEKLVEENINLVYFVFNQLMVKTQFILRYENEFISEGMLALWRAAKKYDPSRGKPSTLFCKAIKRKMIYLLAKIIKETYPEVSMETPILQNDGVTVLTLGETLSYDVDYINEVFKVDDMITTLPEVHKAVIKSKLDGYSFEEIGKEHNFTKQRAEQLYSKSLKRLRRTLKGT